MPRRIGFHRIARWHRLLREPWQRVKLAEDCHYRLALAIAGDEGRRLVSYARLDLEPRRLQLLLQQVGAFCFVIAQLSELPDLLGHLLPVRCVLVYQLQQLRVGAGERLGGCRMGNQRSCGQPQQRSELRPQE
jgi:hypothetical protein